MKGTQILMHGPDKVAECKFDKRGYVCEISKVYHENLLPLCVKENPAFDLERWLLTRSLAVNRKDIAPLREFYGSPAFSSSNGISLFDTYWFADTDTKDWEQVNAYDNWNCKTDSLFLMLMNPSALKDIDTTSPNLTIPGTEQRFWYKAGDQLYLLYGNAQKEVTDYKNAGIENSAVNERGYTILAGHIYAKSLAFTSKEIEMVSFEDYYNVTKQPEKSNMENLRICCEHFGIPKWKTFLAKMCDYDEKTENTSRNLCDVGLLRDTKTLEIIGFAPL